MSKSGKMSYECNSYSASESKQSLGSSESGTGSFGSGKTAVALGTKGAAPQANDFSASKSSKKL